MNKVSNSTFVKPTGWSLWSSMLQPEKNFYFVSFTYACGISLLSLAIPISVQALVNTVTFAVLKQPLIVVSVLLLSLLVFSGILRGLQDLAIEYFQRHFYARNTVEISTRILKAKASSLSSVYTGDLVNRYFEIMTVQKKGAKLLVDGFTLLLQTITGMLLLAFYHPYFLVFDLILIGSLSMVWFLYGPRALETAVLESKAKYKVAAWLEQLADNNTLFNFQKGRVAAYKKTEKKINEYLEKRTKHFSYLFRQIIILLCLYAFMSAIILGLGGFLVIEGQLTLGQLVAAEIVVAIILSGFAKAGGYLESLYDLNAALDKIADFKVLDEEDETNTVTLSAGSKDIHFEQVKITYNNASYVFNQKFTAGKSYLLNEDVDATQRTFLKIIHGHLEPETGHLLYGDTDLAFVSPVSFRERIYLLESPRIIEGTFHENISWGHENISESEINEAIELVGLKEKISMLKDGKETLLYPGTPTLCWGESTRLELGRVMLQKPDWLIISSLFHLLPQSFQKEVIEMVKKKGIGLIVWSSGQSDLSSAFDEVLNFSQVEGSNS